MASYESDEEQIEALKRWWKENGSSLLTGVVVVLAIYFGMSQYQQSTQAESGAASDLYQQLADMGVATMGQKMTDDDLLAAQSVYSQLKAEFDDSIYSRYGALMIAGFQVQQDQLDMAAKELQWVLDNPDLGFLKKADEELQTVARLRLARVKLAQGEAEQALALVASQSVPDSFTSGYSEVEGDIQLALGNRDAATAAYQKALAAIEGGNPSILQLKLQDLGVSPEIL